jgi:predicted transcriptional regulator
MLERADDDFQSIFFELAGDLRLYMLMKLSSKPYRLSQLANDLHATMQESHRNVNRLIDSGLVKKTGEGELLLTPYGKIIVSLIPNFNFPFIHKEYFQEHTVSNLPLKFIQRIGSLNNCEVVVGVMAVLQRWKMVYNNSRIYIKEIMSQVPIDLIETIAERINNNVKFSYIFPNDVVIPKGRNELLKKLGWANMIFRGMVERRLVDKVSIVIIFNENESCISFPTLKGEPDLNIMFYSKDESFHEWCEDFFSYEWMGAKQFDESKLSPEI